jgi:hypothetical protein
MTKIAIEAQVEAIKKAAEQASKSKETALQFLLDAGIVRQQDTNTKSLTPKSSSKK